MLETHCAKAFGRWIIANEVLQSNIQKTWEQLLNDAEQEGVSYKKRYVFSLFHSLVVGASAKDSADAYDQAEPWHDFVDFIRVEAPNHVDGMLLGATYWHDSFDGVSLSLGWLLQNAIRVQHGLAPLNLVFTDSEIENCLRDFAYNDGSLFRTHLHELMAEDEEFPDY